MTRTIAGNDDWDEDEVRTPGQPAAHPDQMNVIHQ